jgi:hypothetical protein
MRRDEMTDSQNTTNHGQLNEAPAVSGAKFCYLPMCCMITTHTLYTYMYIHCCTPLVTLFMLIFF